MRVGLVAAGLALAACGKPAEGGTDLVLYNGKIFTSSLAHPFVEAIRIRVRG